jgi:hypothetical protein
VHVGTFFKRRKCFYCTTIARATNLPDKTSSTFASGRRWQLSCAAEESAWRASLLPSVLLRSRRLTRCRRQPLPRSASASTSWIRCARYRCRPLESSCCWSPRVRPHLSQAQIRQYSRTTCCSIGHQAVTYSPLASYQCLSGGGIRLCHDGYSDVPSQPCGCRT